MVRPVFRAAALAALVLAPACGPVSEPIVQPLPQGAALDTAGRPFVQPVSVPEEYQRAVAQGTRSATGAPGPRYWQQRVRYDIRATVDPRVPRVTGSERIVYHNRSPDQLTYVVMNLYQNLFRAGRVGENSPLNTGGLVLTRFVVQGQRLGELSAADYEANQREGRGVAGYVVQGTLSRVILPRPLAPGDSAVFEIDWNFKVPPGGAPRTGFEDALGGRVLQVAQWYPQIAVYDDVVGPDVTGYTGQGEFYLEYGDFDVAITVPAGWLVGATGTLQNPEEVLSAQTRQRLAQALQTDSVVPVVTRADFEGNRATTAGTGGSLTWRFSARDVRDVAFATSNRYLWDATRALVRDERGGTRTVAVHAFYRPGAPHWTLGARFGDHATEYLSRRIIPYLYPQITVSEGPIYGMEYPMLVFIGRPEAERGLQEVIAHEVAHEWFPMMVGQDEAAFAWMDEGFTTYHEALAANDYYTGNNHFLQPRQVYLSVAGNKMEAPLMRSADQMDDAAMGIAAYYKPGTLLRSLSAVVGDSVMDAAMRTYAREWLLKHPYPLDWFNTVERVSGRDLDWFWYPFWFRTATFDQGIASVTPGAGNVTVAVRDYGQAPGPTFVTVTTRGGRTVTATIPIERWLSPSTRLQTITIDVPDAVARVELDPQQFFPDVNRRNNGWSGN